MMTRDKTWAACGLAGIVVLAGGFWTGRSLSSPTVTPDVQTGTVQFVSPGTIQFVFRPLGQHRASGYDLGANVPWRNAYGSCHLDGRPACMRPFSHGQRITIGVVDVAPVAGALGGPVIVWLECPSRRVPTFPIVSPAASPSQ